MGFIDQEDGQFNQHQFNWPDDSSAPPSKKKGFHVLTNDEKARIDYDKESLQVNGGQYISKETNTSIIRKSNLRKTAPVSRDPIIKRKYSNLRLSEANMLMTLNSYELGLFDPNNPPIADNIERVQISDEDLETIYNTEINTYNLKSFDPVEQTYTDGNGQEYKTNIKTIDESKDPKNFLTLEQFKEQYRLSGRKAYLTNLLKWRGING